MIWSHYKPRYIPAWHMFVLFRRVLDNLNVDDTPDYETESIEEINTQTVALSKKRHDLKMHD